MIKCRAVTVERLEDDNEDDEKKLSAQNRQEHSREGGRTVRLNCIHFYARGLIGKGPVPLLRPN